MCDCITEVNKLLDEHNTTLALPMFGARRPFVQTEKLESTKRGKPPMMQATFCPFCGEKYPARDGDEQAA